MHKPLKLPRERTVLVLVDLQEEHRADHRYLVQDYDQVVGNAADLLMAARSAEVDILHVAYIRDFSVVPRRPFEPVTATGEPVFSDMGRAGIEFSPEIAPLPNEPLFRKNDTSCFSEPGFAQRVRDLAPEWMIICGAWTEACVAATVRDAGRAGLRVLLVKDACGSGTRAMHMTGVIHMANRLYGGAISDTDTAKRLLAGETCACWQLEGTTALRFDADTIETVFRGL